MSENYDVDCARYYRAKYYIYRNLHKDCFSVKYKGRVIAHLTDLVAFGVTFKVSQAGREKVLRERKKYVHAYVVADSYAPSLGALTEEADNIREVYYNPYKCNTFMLGDLPIDSARCAYLQDNKVYI